MVSSFTIQRFAADGRPQTSSFTGHENDVLEVADSIANEARPEGCTVVVTCSQSGAIIHVASSREALAAAS